MTRALVAAWPDWPVVAAGCPSEVPAAVVAANEVKAVTAAARAEGVRPGLRRREAQRRCPELEVLAADPGRDARMWEPVVAAVETLTPAVEVIRPGRLCLATRGPSRYFGGDAALAERVQEVAEVAAGQPGCLVGVADGRFAAAIAALVSAGGGGEPVVVPPGASRRWIAPQPVTALGAGYRDLSDLLIRLGVRTLGDLAALPAASMAGRFGPEGIAAHRLARGLDDHPPSARVPPPDLACHAEFDPPEQRVEAAAFVAKSLADDLQERLRAASLAAAAVVIEVETEHGERLVRQWRHDGMLSAAALSERTRWQLEGWLEGPAGSGPTGGLTLLRLEPVEVAPSTGRQSGFWGQTSDADRRAARAMARVQGLLGAEAVCTGVVVGGRSCADQMRLVPWGDARPERWHPPVADQPAAPPTRQPGRQPGHHPGSQPGHHPGRQPGHHPGHHPGGAEPRRAAARASRAEGPPPWPGRLAGPSPALVHRPPPPADVLDAEGHEVKVNGRGVISAAPVWLAWEAGRGRVEGWAGPWPLEERWWEAGGRRRARVQLLLDDGTAHLVCREKGGWMLEASYG